MLREEKKYENAGEGLIADRNGRSKKGDSLKECLSIILHYASGRYLRRMGDYVMEPHPNVHGAFICMKDAGEAKLSSEKFINRLLRSCEAYNTSTLLKQLQTWFQQTDNVSFPIIYENDSDRLFTALRDGYIYHKTGEFYNLGRFQEVFGHNPLCLHYFDVTFADLVTPTPDWNKFLAYQFDEDVRYYLEVLLGRLGFRVAEMDNWEVAPYFFGLAGSGKSTILRCLGHMYPTVSINSHLCSKFGLGDLRDKGVVIIPDVSEKLPKQLDQADIQSMVTGEPLTTIVRYKGSLSENWRSALALAGNVNLHQLYNDNMGQISRRFVVFCLLRNVGNADSTLSSKIKDEVPAIWYRCLCRYLEVLQRPESKGNIWDILPKQLFDWRQWLSKGDDLVQQFIKSGTLTHQVVECEDYMLDPEEFQDHFKKYCRQFGFAVPKGVDKDGLSDLGYTTKRFDVCKECLQLPKMKAGFTGCCKTTRKQLIRIRGVKIIPRRATELVENTEREVESYKEPKRRNTVGALAPVAPVAREQKRVKVRNEAAAQGEHVAALSASGGTSSPRVDANQRRSPRLQVIRVPFHDL